MKSKVVLLCAAFVFLYTINDAFAVGYGGIGGRPAFPSADDHRTSSWFIYDLEPGQQKQDAVEVINNSDETVEVFVYAQGSIKSSDGGFALKQMGDPREGVGAWVRFYTDPPADHGTTTDDIISFCDSLPDEAEDEPGQQLLDWCVGMELIELTLDAGTSQLVPFVFRVSESADTGEHTGGILIQKKEVEQQAGSGISISTRVGVRIYETVPGEIVKQLELTGFTLEDDKQNGFLKATLSLENTGNTSIDADIDLIFTDPLIKQNRQSVKRTVQVLREDEFTTNFELPRPKIGFLKVSPSISYTDGSGIVRNLQLKPLGIWIIPWLPVSLLGGGAILLVAGSVIMILFRRRKIGVADWKACKIKKGETIAVLAQKAGISWKTIAKINKLKAPYVLEAGSSLLLPPVVTARKRTRRAKNTTERNGGRKRGVKKNR